MTLAKRQKPACARGRTVTAPTDTVMKGRVYYPGGIHSCYAYVRSRHVCSAPPSRKTGYIHLRRSMNSGDEPSPSTEAAYRIDPERRALVCGMGVFSQNDGRQTAAVDVATNLVARHWAEAMVRGERERGLREAFRVFAALVPLELRANTSTGLKGAAAHELVSRGLDALEGAALRLFARRHPAYEWLWMIRRAPVEVLFPFQHGEYLRASMASLALTGNTTACHAGPNGSFAARGRPARSLAFLTGFAEAYTDLRGTRRVLARGGHLVIQWDQRRVGNSRSEGLDRRLQAYDRRAFAEQSWGGLGVHIEDLGGHRTRSGELDSDKIATVMLRSEPSFEAPNDAFPAPRVERYIEDFIRLDEVFELLAADTGALAPHLHEDFAVLCPLLWAYRALAQEGAMKRESIRQVGYSIHLTAERDLSESGVLGRRLADGLAWFRQRAPYLKTPSTTDELLERLRALTGGGWRGQVGPVMFPLADGFGVDWAIATERLRASIRLIGDEGHAANVRGTTFEVHTQRLIDTTECSPPPWLRGMLRKQLRIDRKQIGDIDAAAIIPGTNIHLLISCKSYPFTAAYERGDYEPVRNIDSKLSKDLVKALEFVERLRERRSGDNYQIPEDVALVPIVVTPRLMYTDLPVAHRELLEDDDGGLFCIAGLTELRLYLERFVIQAEQADEASVDPTDPDVAPPL